MQHWSVVASAEAAKHDSPTMVLPIPGIPLSVGTIEEYVAKSPDGTLTRQINKARYYRDAAGRMRIEANSIDGTLAGVALDKIDNRAS